MKARVAAYDAALASGNLAALLYLSSLGSADAEGGASDFWSHEGADYEYWARWASSYLVIGGTDPWGIPLSQQPQFTPERRID